MHSNILVFKIVNIGNCDVNLNMTFFSRECFKKKCFENLNVE